MDSLAKKVSGYRMLALLLAFGAAYSLHKGQDVSWDLKNYHLYNAWAFLHGRLTIDLAPVGLQGFFNPLLDVPYFWLGVGPLHHYPRLLAAFQGLWYGALVFVVLRISVRFAEIRGRRYGLIDLFAVLIGVTGTMVISQIGTSTNEMPLALLVMLSFYILLPLAGSSSSVHPTRTAVAAGLLCGLAAGLKPTAVVYTPALGIALWLALGAGGVAWRTSIIFGASAFVAFLAAYGWWGWELYRLTGNPVFPMFNEVFHSVWAPPTAGTDRQFMPRNVLQWVFYPFYWIHKNRYQGGNTFADARYAAAMISGVLLAVLSWIPRSSDARPDRAARFLTWFMAIGYVLWLVLYSILRYAVSLEVMTGLLIMTAIQALAELRWLRSVHPKAAVWSMAAVVILLGSYSRYTDWGNAYFGEISFAIAPGSVPPKSMVLVIGQPNAYVVPFIDGAERSEFVGITWLTAETEAYRLGELTRTRVMAHRGPMYAILRDGDAPDLAQLQEILPTANLVECKRIFNYAEQTKRGRDISEGFRLCRMAR